MQEMDVVIDQREIMLYNNMQEQSTAFHPQDHKNELRCAAPELILSDEDSETCEFVQRSKHARIMNVLGNSSNRITENSVMLVADTPSAIDKRVRFSAVEVRIYSITIGDHPLVSMYPLSLDWSYNILGERTIDEFEAEKAREKRPNKTKAIPANRGIQAPRLHVTERMARLVDVTGKSNRELYIWERKRQTLSREERFTKVQE